MSYRRSFHQGYPLRQSCQVCRKPDAAAVRVEWGCDSSSVEAQLFIPCVRCIGQDPKCAICRGIGYEALHDCPRKLLEQDEDACQLFALYQVYPVALPLAGGILNQPARYVNAMRLIASACAELEGDIRREREAEDRHGQAT